MPSFFSRAVGAGLRGLQTSEWRRLSKKYNPREEEPTYALDEIKKVRQKHGSLRNGIKHQAKVIGNDILKTYKRVEKDVKGWTLKDNPVTRIPKGVQASWGKTRHYDTASNKKIARDLWDTWKEEARIDRERIRQEHPDLETVWRQADENKKRLKEASARREQRFQEYMSHKKPTPVELMKKYPMNTTEQHVTHKLGKQKSKEKIRNAVKDPYAYLPDVAFQPALNEEEYATVTRMQKKAPKDFKLYRKKNRWEAYAKQRRDKWGEEYLNPKNTPEQNKRYYARYAQEDDTRNKHLATRDALMKKHRQSPPPAKLKEETEEQKKERLYSNALVMEAMKKEKNKNLRDAILREEKYNKNADLAKYGEEWLKSPKKNLGGMPIASRIRVRLYGNGGASA